MRKRERDEAACIDEQRIVTNFVAPSHVPIHVGLCRAPNMSGSATFWAFSLEPGSTLSQQVPRGAKVCVTSAVLAAPSAERVVLTASSNGAKAVLCNLFGNHHKHARLGQPFHDDFELSVSAGAVAVHVSGFSQGDLGPVEVLEGPPLKAKPKAAAAAAGASKERLALTDRSADGIAADSIAQRARAVTSEDVMGGADDGEEDDEGSEEEGEEEEESEEGEEEEEEMDFSAEEVDDDDDDDDEEEEEGDDAMPLAPKSVEAILKGRAAAATATAGTKRPAAASAPAPPPPSKAAKPAEKSASKPAAPAPAAAAAAAPAAATASSSSSAAFIKAAKFSGAKAGYVFKKGTQGVGYYKDTPPVPQLKGGAAAAAAGGNNKSEPSWNRLPSGVEIQQVKPGGGMAVAAWGKKVKVAYRGCLTSGKQFDAGTIDFKLGAGEVIKGWDLGIKGMKVGGQRRLRIPPQLAYGARGSPPVIPGNATLVFDVELKRC